MQRLAEALYNLQPGQMLVGQTPTLGELLKLWVRRHEEGFDLYVTSMLEPGEVPLRSPRNTVGRDLVSATEVLEALHCLEEVYRVEPRAFHDLPVTLRTATPLLLQLIEEHVLRVPHSTLTGEFGPDDLPAEVVQLKSVRELEVCDDDDVEDLLLTGP